MYLNDIDYSYFEGYTPDPLAVQIVYPLHFVLICMFFISVITCFVGEFY